MRYNKKIGKSYKNIQKETKLPLFSSNFESSRKVIKNVDS